MRCKGDARFATAGTGASTIFQPLLTMTNGKSIALTVKLYAA
jgi:hypothetical protein